MIQKLKQFIQKMNESGVPLPFVRVNGKPSMTGTFAWLSFNTAILGQIGKVTSFLGPVDLSSANYLFFGCLAAHMGNKFMGDGKKIKVESSKKEGE